jgi:hypothetical protein
MKTITEYRPMIFSRLTPRSQYLSRKRRRAGIEVLAALAYGVTGLWLSLDTGFAPWQWQFWLMFAPLFAAGELAWRVLPGGAGRGCRV